MVKAKFSTSFEAKKKRIARLPELMRTVMESYAKKHALRMVELFQEGIAERTFALEPLRPQTVTRKAALGMQSPDSPLYGYGDDADVQTTYANMLRIKKVGNKFSVRPSTAYHYQTDEDREKGRKKIKLADLLRVHEYGTTIENGFGLGTFIRIPPRPAFRMAYQAVMKEIKRGENTKMVREAIASYVNGSDTEALEIIARRQFSGDIGWDEKDE